MSRFQAKSKAMKESFQVVIAKTLTNEKSEKMKGIVNKFSVAFELLIRSCQRK
jgi:hypothetical protein